MNTTEVQYVWGLRYIDDIILSRDRVFDGESYLPWQPRYHMTDALFSTVALLDASATLLERVAYDPYGEARHQWPADLDGDGMVTQQEIGQIRSLAQANGSTGTPIEDANYHVDADLNRDGIIDSVDYQMANAQGTKPSVPKGVLSAAGNVIGYAGYVWNGETVVVEGNGRVLSGGLYTVRHRHYYADLGRCATTWELPLFISGVSVDRKGDTQ
jgi:hypothetical protein